MGVKHVFNASPGDLILTSRWNADHTVDGLPTMQCITLLAEPNGYDITCSSSGVWYPSSDDSNPLRFYIPGARGLSFDRVDTTVRWSATGAGTPTTTMRIVQQSSKTTYAGQAYFTASAGTMTATIDPALNITWPAGNTEYVIQVSSDIAGSVVTLYSVKLWVWVA